MSRISRYRFLKNYIDAYMFYRKCNKDIDKINRLHINYIIVNNLDIVDKKEYKDNKYSHYFYRCGVLLLLDKMVKTR